jgi:hypothetical protein
LAYERPQQRIRRQRFERVIGLAAPVFDLALAAGDRLSRIVGRDDDYIPIRAPGEAFDLPSGRREDGTTA